MTSAVLIPGAGGMGWYWHIVERDLQARGYDAIAVDLAARGRIGLPAYADAVVDAVDGRTDVALIAQSMGAFTAPLVWQRIPTRLVVFVNAMIPLPGETPGEWWKNVGSEQARTAAAVSAGYSVEFDLATYFLHDIPAELLPEMESHASCQLDERFDDRCDSDAWPAISIHVVAGRDDRSSRSSFSSASPANGSASIPSSCRADIWPPSATRTNSPPSSPDTSDRHEFIDESRRSTRGWRLHGRASGFSLTVQVRPVAGRWKVIRIGSSCG